MATLKQKQDLIDCLCGKVITIDLDIQQINRYWELTDTDGWNNTPPDEETTRKMDELFYDVRDDFCLQLREQTDIDYLEMQDDPYYLQPYMDAWEDGWEDQKASTKWLETPYGYKLKIKYEYKSFDK